MKTTGDPVEDARLALFMLAEARDVFVRIGARKTAARVRYAISSAKGAVRAAGYRQNRTKIAASAIEA